MPNFEIEFSVSNDAIYVGVVASAGITHGYYAFEFTDPNGTIIKDIPIDFFTNPVPVIVSDIDVTNTTQQVYTFAYSGFVFGTYKYRAVYRETGSFGTNNNSLSEAKKNYVLSAKTGTITAVEGVSSIVATDTTDYTGVSVLNRSISYVNLDTLATNSNSTTSITTPSLGNYQFTINVIRYQSNVVDATYTVSEIQRVITNLTINSNVNMPNFAFEFDMTLAQLNVTITPTVGTTTGYYAFELIAPTGVTFKSVATNFFTSPITTADVTTTVSTVWTKALPLDINNVVQYGTYQFRALYKQAGGYGNDDNSFSEVFRTALITKKLGVVTAVPDFGLNQINITDITDYGTATITSRLLRGYVVGGTSQSSTGSTLAVAPIGDYIIDLNAVIRQAYTINAVYSATALQTVTAILSSISYYKNLPDNICKAKVILDGYDDIFCKEGRRLKDTELARYLQLTSRLALIGAALHASSSISCAVDAMKELETLVK